MSDEVIWLDQGWQPSLIGFVPSRKAWNAEMKRQKQRPAKQYPFDADHLCVGRVEWMVHNGNGDSVILVCLNENLIGDDPVHLVCTIAHEASHVIDFAFEHTGMKPCTETRAYSLEAIVRGLLNAYSSTIGKDKKLAL